MDKNDNIDEILKIAYGYLEIGDIENAKRTYLEGLKRYPDNLSILNNLAQCHRMMGDTKKSNEYHEKLIRLCECKTSPEILMIKANSQMNMNNLTDALETYEKILTENPKNTQALLQVSIILTEKEEYEKSNRYLNRILEIEDKNIPALLRMGINFYCLGEYENTKECYSKVLEISPKHEDAIRLKGELLKETGDKQGLKSHIRNVLKVKPRSAYTLMLKAMECANENNDKKALEFFNRAISVDPYLDEAYFNKAGFLMLKKRYDEAIECYKKAFEINPESGGIIDREGLFELLEQMKNANQSQ